MKKVVVLLLVFISARISFAQTFMHGAGLGVCVSVINDAEVGVFYMFNYSPRVSFAEGDNFSVSLGVPIALGVSGSYSYSSYYGESNSLGYMIKAPVMLDLNFGPGAHKETDSRFGGFIGGGFGLYHGNFYSIVVDDYYGDYYQYTNVTSYGPAANAGFRFAVGRNQKNIQVRFSYMKGLNDSKPSVFDIGAGFNF
jgi:hypothetical protein